MFGFVDIILIVILILFVLSGFASGFVRSIGNLVGLILGLFLASWGLLWLDQQFNILGKPFLSIVIFLTIAALVSFLIGWITDLVEGLRKILSIIPFLKTINRLLGGIVGFTEGLLAIIAIAYFAQAYLPPGGLKESILESLIASWLVQVTGIVSWIFPTVVAYAS